MDAIKQLNEAVKDAIEGGKGVKSLRSTLDRLFGIKRCERWFYQLYEVIDGRDSVIQQFAKLLLAWKVDDRASAEYVWTNLDLIFHQGYTAGQPQLETPIETLVCGMETEIRKLGKELQKVKRLLRLK